MDTALDAASYSALADRLSSLGSRLEVLIGDSLRAEGIVPHTVKPRVKSWESIQRKFASAPSKYEDLSAMTDLLGVRVIAYFEDDVDAIAERLTSEFVVDEENSVDKRALLEADRFGYLSLHYVVSLSASRTNLPEYAPYAGQKFEIQIRSILQHSWAEIEHDLGYKADEALPREFRRRFSRLAGLLEVADAEFSSLRVELDRHEEEVAKIISTDADLPLDQTTMIALLDESDAIQAIEDDLARQLDTPGIASTVNPHYVRQRIAELGVVGIDTVPALRAALDEAGQDITAFATAWVARNGGSHVITHKLERGISMFYLQLLLLAKLDDEQIQLDPRFARRTEMVAVLKEVWSSLNPNAESAGAD